MAYDIRSVRNITDLIGYFSENLNWAIDIDDFDDIEDISYDFEAEDIGLKEENFAKISSLRQLQPLVDGQQWGIFCIEFDSNKFEVSALRKILSKFVPKRRSMIDHAVWEQQDLLFICNWGEDNNRTIGIAHFEDQEKGLPQIKMISCAPALEDFTQIKVFEDRLVQLAWPKNTSNIEAWREAWSNAFTSGYRQTIQDSSTLTIQLAAEAQNIRNRILSILDVETKNGYVHLLYDKFKDTLIHDMSEQQFADMYAQTVVYGLFSARCMDSTQDDFSAAEAIDCIPSTNPFLKSLMRECLGSQGSNKLSFDELEIGNVVDLLLHTKTDEIIKDFNRQTGGGREDPVIHFYEEFLTAYDKSQKVQRGVYYTPQPVVNFIVRAVDSILKTEFGYEDGLATTDTKKIKVMRESKRRVNGYITKVEEQIDVPAVQILDPATGTGTFLRQTILQIYENFQQKHKGEPKAAVAVLWNKYVDESLLPRLNGFELMMAPYAVAHMKLAMVLKDTGYDFSGEHRLNVFLTNSLEKAGNSDNQLTLFDDPLATESVEANKAKKNGGINICIGNPPYNGSSSNNNEWIMMLMDDYKKEPGTNIQLQERNSKFVNDDYVKFFRYVQSLVHNAESGIVAFINPHGYLDAPTFRGIRWSLLTDFEKVYVINLHGNTNRGEKSPDGSVDENVFDIMQGVCINILVKKKTSTKKVAEVLYADLYGSRDSKYRFLNEQTINGINWTKVNPVDPFYFLVPRDNSRMEEYRKGVKVSELFSSSCMGFQTHRDKFAVAFTREEICERYRDLCSDVVDSALQTKYALKDTRDWKISDARKRAIEQEVDFFVTKCQYRPFDVRWCYLDYTFMDFPRKELTDNVLNKDNLCLLIPRQQAKAGFRHALISRYPSDSCAVSTASREGNQVFTLYSYADYFEEKNKRTSNVNPAALRRLLSEIQISAESVLPEDVMFYTYAILYSPSYREKYSEYIQSDFPIITKPHSTDFFVRMVAYGKALASCHMLEKDEKYIVDGFEFVGEGDCSITKPLYKDGSIYINKTQRFSNVTEEIWNFTIGGHQPAQLWLKHRKEQVLTVDDITYFQKMLDSICQTIAIMTEIDAITK